LSDNGRGELLGCAGTANVNGSGLARVDSFIYSGRDSVGMFIQVQVSQHHDGREEHGSGVSTVLVLNVKGNVTTTLFDTCQWYSPSLSTFSITYRFEHGKLATNVTTRDQTRTTDQTSTLDRE